MIGFQFIYQLLLFYFNNSQSGEDLAGLLQNQAGAKNKKKSRACQAFIQTHCSAYTHTSQNVLNGLSEKLKTFLVSFLFVEITVLNEFGLMLSLLLLLDTKIFNFIM